MPTTTASAAPAVQPEDARVGDRVAGQSLEQRAAQRDARTDDDGDDGAVEAGRDDAGRLGIHRHRR